MSWLAWLVLVLLAAFCGFVWGRATAPRKPAEPLIADEVDMRMILLDPDRWLRQLRGKVRSVHTLSPSSSWPPRYASFLLDARGEGHWLEEGRLRAVVEGNAQWLAENLGVPYESDD
jgi:hypothetical protein